MKLFRSSRRYKKSVLALFLCSAMMALPYGGQAIDFLPVADVHTGMEGHADTVVQGDDISSFNVKVLGVMRDRGPSGDLILAKFSGPVIDETGGIVHGMSGSPVYINNKLVGAVAYGWGFADGTIGMITPIEDMVKLWNIPYESSVSNPWKDSRLIPLGTPLMAYGFDGDALDFMKDKLPEYGYSTYATAAADGDESPKPLKAGGSVAALLVDGDLKLGAIGTVTYVDQDHLVAFGHPFLKRGSVGYFMHNASIFTVVRSVNSGFKLGSMGAEVGAITEDRGSGIAGKTGQIMSGIPMDITIRDLDMNRSKEAAVKIVDAGELSPTLAATSVYSFLNKTLDRSGEGTATVAIKIQPRDGSIPPLERTNMFYSSESIGLKSVDEFYNIVDALMNNRFINYEIAGIQVETDVTKTPKTALIKDATLTPGIASPGDTIVIEVHLQPFRGKEVTKEVFFTIPKDQPLGKVTLEVRGGGVVPLPYLLEKQKYNLTDEIIRRLKTYKSFDEFYKELRKADTNNQIVVEILEDGISMVDSGDGDTTKKAKLENVEENPIPGTVAKPKNKGNLPGVDPEDDEKEHYTAKVDTEYVIRGDGQFILDIKSPADRDKAKAKLAKAQAKAQKEKAKQAEDSKKTDETDKANQDQKTEAQNNDGQKADADKNDGAQKSDDANKANDANNAKDGNKANDATDANKSDTADGNNKTKQTDGGNKGTDSQQVESTDNSTASASDGSAAQ